MILERYRDGDAGADAEFDRPCVFGDAAGNFDRFQAKFNMLNHGSDWAGFSRGEVSFSTLVDQVARFIHQIVARQRQQNMG